MNSKLIHIMSNPNFYLKRVIRKTDHRITLLLLMLISKMKKFREDSNSSVKNNSQKIICFILENLGDTVRASGVINFLKDRYNSFFICTEYNQEIIKLLGIDSRKIIILKRDPGIIDFFELISLLKKHRFEKAIILDHSNSMLFPLYCSKIANVKNIYHFQNKKINRREIIDFSNLHNIDILTAAKFSILKQILADEEFNSIKDLKHIEVSCKSDFYKEFKEYIGIHIGGYGSIVYPVSRKYLENYTYELIVNLLSKGFKVVLTGDSTDEKIFREKLVELSKFKNFENLSGKLSIKELACLLKYLKLYITPDNGTLHLAQAVGCKKIVAIAILGPSSPLLVKGKNTFILREDLPCSPCLKFIEFPKKCVFKEQKCLLNLTPEKVVSFVERLTCP